MQEQVNGQAVALYIKAAKLTGRVLAQAMRKFLNKAREPTKPKTGKQSLRSLKRQGASLSSIEITSDNVGSFKSVAREFNVDYALKRDNSETPPRFLVMFKGKDADSVTRAFEAYSRRTLKRKTRKPSALGELEESKKTALEIAAPAKTHRKGALEL